MAIFIFRCPKTDRNVQGWIAAEDVPEDGNTYTPVQCTACRRVHRVNLLTGRVLGGDDDE